MTGAAFVLATLLASTAAATPQRLELGNFRTICLVQDGGPAPVDAFMQRELERQLADLRRVEHAVTGPHACDTARGDVVVRLTVSARGPRQGFDIGMTATDGRATYEENVVVTGRRTILDESVRLADRLFDALVFEPHE